MKIKWTFKGDGTMAAQPIVVGDMVYEGAWSGNLFALDRETGQVRWKEDLGVTGGREGCSPAYAGVTSAPAVVNGVVYVGGGGPYKYALDAKTGTPIWRFYSGDNSKDGGAYNWDPQPSLMARFTQGSPRSAITPSFRASCGRSTQKQVRWIRK